MAGIAGEAPLNRSDRVGTLAWPPAPFRNHFAESMLTLALHSEGNKNIEGLINTYSYDM